ncbi:putative carboxylesterase [delta proteobacterium NaphS2]|nr:putative carboxylesterase [delta proteobacterium NaphS2]
MTMPNQIQGVASKSAESPFRPFPRPPLPPGVKLDANVYVTMRDYINLAVDVYRPEKEGRYPAILSMSPYLKDIQQWPPYLTHSIEAGDSMFFVTKGYVHVIAQIRGCGLSQGQYNFFDSKEGQDGHDLVEWIAKQPWCDGNVGMMGDSYFAVTQYAVAAQQPPHLKCIVPYDALTDIYRDLVYPGGLCFDSFIGMWGVDLLPQLLWPGPVEGKLRPADFFTDIAAHPCDGPYYWDRSAWPKLDKIDTPMLSIAPRTFIHGRGQLHSYPEIKATKKLLVLPPQVFFAHVLFIGSKPLKEYILKWFDHWLKGIETGIMDEPQVTVFDSGTHEWRYENEYPLARTEWKKFYLRSSPEGASTMPPGGIISREAPSGNEAPDTYTAPDLKQVDTETPPAVAYATPALSDDLRVWGPLSMVLHGSSTSLDTVWFVSLLDIAPDGAVEFITQGNLKASFREVDESKSRPGQPYHPFQNPSLLEPDKVYAFRIEMKPIFHTFRAGHKVLVRIQSEEPNHHRMFLHTLYSAEQLPFPWKNAVHHDSVHPSHLVLPVIPDTPPIKAVAPPVTEIEWPPK